ncbi:MAG: hypothetical protein KBT08_01565, partial [Bacteroidales bacterium]|nr:hypothetical protein [Candidatus Cryptobacteroides onthequi]
MKRAFSFILTLASAITLNAQVSLQDVIADPCQSANNLRRYPESEALSLALDTEMQFFALTGQLSYPLERNLKILPAAFVAHVKESTVRS